ncbi:unnamed protein product [Phytophthora fragariaefolia]|uniref:Unnamed protein product n=1 Tax=Phytophthora fragariaefolia TaxID=1490495 RepID=A0A9W6YP81_9STRA|nr:unnamed protein product [Phytophthora fragariaefolia]
MSFDEFGEAFQAGKLAEVVVIRPEEELNSSSRLDEAVLEDAKTALNARSGSEILKNPSDPFYPLIREYQDVVSKEPPPDPGVRHEIDLVPGTCTVSQDTYEGNSVTLLRYSSVSSTRRVWCVRWVGLTNYLQRFSENYAEIARPLSNLLKKDAEWRWNAEYQDAFEAINESLLRAPILALPDPDRSFSVVCDASDFAIGCALLQADAVGRERVIAFESRQLRRRTIQFMRRSYLQ